MRHSLEVKAAGLRDVEILSRSLDNRQVSCDNTRSSKPHQGVIMALDIEKLKRLMRQRRMSQRDLAKNTGKTEAEVSRWLGGTHNFTLRTLAKISTALGEDLIRV